MMVQHEVSLLIVEIQLFASKNSDGQTSVKFGVLFNAYKCTNIFEALVVILRAAKLSEGCQEEKIIAFEGELLLQGVHDNVDNHQLHSCRSVLSLFR
ncbi:LOW QUALITY PROTEIN: costars family protein ABRACL [Oncorhynchus kisutch]|uniref:LOW QUALITY PROTEIN: costars family protein ABRACL n=1 Tax=Oncorhynchus kisutch TaxID=8019 RepID=UPI0009A072DA|nr:LOW QUALITY PROTEIN: costars family protein ABRACL [Oncorhynchus kisutch]